MCFGIIVALISALFFKFTSIDRFPYLETAAVALFGYSSYLLAEGSGLSGIVSILFCGIVMAQYTYTNLSKESKVSYPDMLLNCQELSLNFFSIMALLTETLVFGYLGLSLFVFEEVFDIVFIFAGIVSIYLQIIEILNLKGNYLDR
jgi:NhaP-type Na+/H+ or K+/H+ antiporter